MVVLALIKLFSKVWPVIIKFNLLSVKLELELDCDGYGYGITDGFTDEKFFKFFESLSLL